MKPRFERGHRVLIRSVKDQHYQSKYPQIEQYVGESGTIVEPYGMEASQPYGVSPEVPGLSDNHIYYRVRLDLQSELVTVPEEALEPLESDDSQSL